MPHLQTGQAQPWQDSPSKALQGMIPNGLRNGLSIMWIKANQLLDGLTEPWNKAEGTYRKMKGTDRDLEIVLMIAENGLDEYGDFIGLAESAYKQIGVKLLYKVRSDVAQAILSNEEEAVIGGSENGCVAPVLRPDDIVPMRNYKAWYGAYGKMV